MSNYYDYNFSELPVDVQNSNYIVYYDSLHNRYTVAYEKDYFIDRSSNKVKLYNPSLAVKTYSYNGQEWEYFYRTLGSDIDLETNQLISSNYDIYSYSNSSHTGQPYIGFFRTESPVTTLYTLSSGTITTYFLSEFSILFQIVVFVSVFIIGFFKAFNWLKEQVKGA